MKKVLQAFKNGRYLLALLLIMCYGELASAQSAKITIKGVIKDARNKEPIPGTTVKIQGTQFGASTDINGAYSFVASVNHSATITVAASFTGYKTYTRTIALSGQTEIALSTELHEDALNLSEVVVTGTTVETSKKQLGNAISTLSSKDMEGGAATSIDQAMAGKISGAQISQNSGNPAGGISVRLRGNSTIYGSSDPLYIVDGVIINNSSAELVDLGGYSQNRLVLSIRLISITSKLLKVLRVQLYMAQEQATALYRFLPRKVSQVSLW